MRETSLREFLDGSDRDPEPAASEGGSEGTVGSGGSETTAEGTITPTTTYAWSPDGDACAACGTAVERRWRDADRLVCADCKGW